MDGIVGIDWSRVAAETLEPFERQLITVAVVALLANIIALHFAIGDLFFVRRERADTLSVLRTIRRVIFLGQAMVAQLWLIGGALHIAALPMGDQQAELKNIILIGLAVQLGLKALVDLAFVVYLIHYPVRPAGKTRRRTDVGG